MELKNKEKDNLKAKLQQRVKEEIQTEYNKEISFLKQRSDFCKEFEYFLKTLSLATSGQDIKKKFNNPIIGLYCIQVPLEIFDALGFHPIRLCNMSSAVQRLSCGLLPALSCPVIKSCVGAFSLEQSFEKLCEIIVVPTTCDWNTKLPMLIDNNDKSVYIMELPHIKESERGQKRWIEEIYALKQFLQTHSGRQLRPKQLLVSINKYMKAWQAFARLTEFRRKRLISGTWSIILANAFMLDNVESWTENVNIALKSHIKPKADNNPSIFLAGSPVFFPYLKICELIEEAGMDITADELCTSERIMATANVVYDEPSEYGIFNALAGRYHLACSCPAYTDNQHRLKNILNTLRAHNIKGVIYHLLKGCHPYDIESFYFEKAIKENGFHFLKIETDYSKEDKQNILARLEAFKKTIS